MMTYGLPVRLGVARGWIQFRNVLTDPQTVGFNLVTSLGALGVLYFQRNRTLEGTSLSLSSATLPSILGLLLGFGALTGAVGRISVDREDGTLLRAKAIPDGMVGYLLAAVVAGSLDTLLNMLIVLVPGLFLVDALVTTGVTGTLTLAWVVLLGLLACLPWGAMIGSLARTPQSAFGLTMLGVASIVAVSGIFYPIAALPAWAQTLAQVFPIYWLGLGMRSALLPDSAAAIEIGESWRHLETAAVLGVWAALGLALAPMVLRRMARRESGSAVETRRQRALQRVG